MDRSLRGASLVALDLLVLYTVGLPSYTCQQHSSKRQASAFEDPKIETSQTTDFFHAEDCISTPLILLVAGRLSSFLPFLAHRHATVTGPLPISPLRPHPSRHHLISIWIQQHHHPLPRTGNK